MTSSGMKRGLAVAAVSALAVTGVPLTAHAKSLQELGAKDTVTLLSQYSTIASTDNDGTNSKVSLVANAGTGVASVQFRYSTSAGGTYTNIDSPSRGTPTAPSLTTGRFRLRYTTSSSIFRPRG